MANGLDTAREGLAALDDDVNHLFALVSNGLASATEAFLASDREAARELAANEQLIDAVYRRAENLAHDELVLGSERGGDRVHHLVLVLQILPELERSGDLVEHIAMRASQGLARTLTPTCRGLVQQMGDTATNLWHLAAGIYANRADGVVASLRIEDDELDDLHVRLTAELSGEDMPMAVAIEMGLVARFFERLGDHAVNIAHRLSAWETAV